ncbi:MAG TPA: hypothetical protein DDW86_00590, partial [Clostridiales bacterium]|nr:hypothetical protein [Clostridiales bacterium]
SFSPFLSTDAVSVFGGVAFAVGFGAPAKNGNGIRGQERRKADKVRIRGWSGHSCGIDLPGRFADPSPVDYPYYKEEKTKEKRLYLPINSTDQGRKRFYFLKNIILSG